MKSQHLNLHETVGLFVSQWLYSLYNIILDKQACLFSLAAVGFTAGSTSDRSGYATCATGAVVS